MGWSHRTTLIPGLRGDRIPGLHQAFLLSKIINEYLPEGEEPIPEVPFYNTPDGMPPKDRKR